VFAGIKQGVGRIPQQKKKTKKDEGIRQRNAQKIVVPEKGINTMILLCNGGEAKEKETARKGKRGERWFGSRRKRRKKGIKGFA